MSVADIEAALVAVGITRVTLSRCGGTWAAETPADGGFAMATGPTLADALGRLIETAATQPELGMGGESMMPWSER